MCEVCDRLIDEIVYATEKGWFGTYIVTIDDKEFEVLYDGFDDIATIYYHIDEIDRCPFCHVDLEFKLQQSMTPTEMVVVKKLGLCTINELCLKCINNVSCDDCQMKDILNGRLCKVLKLLVQEIPNQDIFNVDIKLTGGDKND